jgi:hypothetical protein
VSKDKLETKKVDSVQGTRGDDRVF